MSGSLYVGSAVNFKNRWERHVKDLKKGTHHSIYLQRAWERYGSEAFEFRVILQCAPDRLIVHEQGAIDFLKPVYNMSPTAGSSRGVKHTPEARANMSAAAKGKTVSAETRAKLSVAAKGRVFSPECLAKRSASLKGRRFSAEHCEKLCLARQGRVFTETTKAKMSSSHRGITPETRAKMAASAKGRVFTPQHRANLSAAKTGLTQSPDHIAKRVASFKRNRADTQRGITLHTHYDQGAL